MQLSDIPVRFPVPFASSAGAGYIRAIPTPHQTATTTDAPASLHDGFPPETFTPLSSGGIPPSGADINGILNQLSAWARWMAAGVPAIYDSGFAAAIGGYPQNAILASSTTGRLWQSTVDNNATDPDGVGASGWVSFTAKLEQNGQVRATLSAPNSYSVTFPTPFPTACTGVQLTGVNASASASRDNWPQLVSRSATGFTYVIQGSVTGGDNTLDGIDWEAKGI